MKGVKSASMKSLGVYLRSGSALLALALAGCAVGPAYHPPKAPNVPLTPRPLPASTLRAAGVAQHFEWQGRIMGDWWTLYHAPRLNALIQQALADNPSLQAAQATLLAAEENTRAVQGGLLPSVVATAGIQRTRQAAATGGVVDAQGGIPAYTLHTASLSLSYPLDIFGGQRRQVESARAAADNQRWQLEAAYLTLTSNIVVAAVNEASLNAQIAATRTVIADERHLLRILQRQVQLGGAAPTHALQQQAALAQQEAALPPLEQQLAQAQNQLAAYAGQFPGSFHMPSFTLAALTLPQDIPVSLPSQIVAQRPDIQAAAAQLHEATANLGVADANLLPNITLSASVGHSALSGASLFTPQSLLWSLVASATQPLFEGGTLTARRKQALYELHAAADHYQSTVISAFQNVADALSALDYDAATLAAAQTAEQAAAQSLKVTQAQYRLGGEPFATVLTAEVTYQTALIAEIKAQAARLSDTAGLYQALGGGWWNRQDVAKPCCGVIP